jgi:hypothetical protein
VKSRTTEKFRKAFAELPEQVRRHAKNVYKIFQNNPYHPSLHFKQVHSIKPVYSVRINRDFRAVGVRENEEIIWFWIGPHDEYDRLIARL